MKRIAFSLAALLLAGLLPNRGMARDAGPQQSPAEAKKEDAAPPPLRLDGLVRTSKGIPVPGAPVRLLHLPTGRAWMITTDENGNFAVLDLPPGRYRLEAGHLGLGTVSQEVDIPLDSVAPIELTLHIAPPAPKTEKVETPAPSPAQPEAAKPAAAEAESTSKPSLIRGTVEDPSGDPVVEAVVKLTRQPAGPTVKAVTDGSGYFVFTEVALGDYVLHVKVEGFEKMELDIRVGTTPTPRQRLQLNVATVSQEITVSARSADPISPDQNATAVQLEHDLLKYLPSKNENPLAVVSLFVDPAANGMEGTKIIVDGVEVSELDEPASSIKTVAVNSNPYSTEFGRPGKGRIEVVTRGGSQRRFHRRFTFTLRDASMDARNAFAQVRPPRRRELFAGQIDGPIVRDKVTFFLGGEYLKDNATAFVNAQTPSGSLLESVGIPLRTTRLFGRIDIRLTPLQILSVRYNWSRHSLPNQGVGAFDLPERAWNATHETHEVRISETAIGSTNFSNEVRFDFRSRRNDANSVTDAPAILVLGAFSSGGGQISRRDRQEEIDVQELVSYIHGKQTFRLGATVKSKFVDLTDRSNFGGTFTFSDLATFASNQPFLFTVNQGDPRVSFLQHEFAYFFQDEIRLRPRFSLLLGLRHELQSNLQYHRNLAPRVALAYSTADGRTVLRAGAGIFYQRQPVILGQQFLLLNGSHLRQIVIRDPSFPLAGNHFAPPNLPPPSVVRIDPNIKTPYAIQASFGVERKLGRQSYLSAEYTMLRGLELYRTRNLNAPLPATGLRSDPNFLNINEFETSGSSSSHSFSLSFRRSVRNLQFVSQYALSRTMDDTSGLFSLPADNFNLRDERGRADFDQRHRFSFAGTLKLPHGFAFGLIASVRSGIPFNITTGFDNNHDTVANDRPPGVGRNAGKGPGFANVDLRFAKKFILRKSKNKEETSREVEFCLDAFNLLNQVNFKNYIGTLSSPFFGRANSAYPARELQASVRVSF